MEVKRGEIYYIEVNKYRPDVGSMQGGNRPGIIVSNAMNNKHSPIFEIVYLTSAPKKDLPTHCTIRSTGRLSTALCEQITTISEEQIGNYLGTCTKQEMDAVDMCMAISLGLDPQPVPNEEINTTEREALQREIEAFKNERDKLRELLQKASAKIEELQATTPDGASLEEVAELRMELERSRAREALLRELLQEAHK